MVMVVLVSFFFSPLISLKEIIQREGRIQVSLHYKIIFLFLISNPKGTFCSMLKKQTTVVSALANSWVESQRQNVAPHIL